MCAAKRIKESPPIPINPIIPNGSNVKVITITLAKAGMDSHMSWG